MYPGEYPQPLTRKTVVNCPVVSGYVTARLQSQDIMNPPTISGGNTATNMMVTFENVGNVQFSVLLQETDDRSSSGTRYPLMSAVPLVAGAQSTHYVSGKLPYVEVYCSGTTEGILRMQIDSQRRFTEMGFDRLDPFYPPQLWQARTYPGPIS